MATPENNVQVDNEVQVVAFKLRDEEYGFNILNVKEIKGLTDIGSFIDHL